jgi:hypothetical protein
MKVKIIRGFAQLELEVLEQMEDSVFPITTDGL